MDDISPEILERFLLNEGTSGENEIVMQWLKASGLKEDQVRQLIHLPDGVQFMLSLDADADWAKVRSRLPKQRSAYRMSTWLRVAAAVTLLIGTAAVFFLFQLNIIGNERFVIVNNEIDVKQITLPDGSSIYLRPGAKIIYMENFSVDRSLQMTGEAFFDVKRFPAKPFVIQATDCHVRVLGTSFNVKTDSMETEVIVSTGKVALQADPQMVYLEKGEKGVYRKGELAVKSYNDDVNFLSWKTHILMFENTSLDKVIRDLEQHFGVRITITSLVKQWPTYTSQFENPTLEEVLAELKQVLAIEYTIKDNVVTLDFKN